MVRVSSSPVPKCKSVKCSFSVVVPVFSTHCHKVPSKSVISLSLYTSADSKWKGRRRNLVREISNVGGEALATEE